MAATDELEVHPLAARDEGERGELLPRLLGVRHITHAQQWKPYATNLYIYSLYLDHFHAACGDVPLRLDDAILEQVAGLVSISLWKARRSIQTAVAFSPFPDGFEGRLPEREGFQALPGMAGCDRRLGGTPSPPEGRTAKHTPQLPSPNP